MVLEKEEGTGMKLSLSVALILLAPALTLADSSALILNGVPGDPEHAERFNNWTEATRKALTDNMGFSPDRVIVLADKQTAKAEIQKAFAKLKEQLKPADQFFLFFIGHGSYEGDYKFNISGPDLTATEYNQLLSTLNVGRIVIINGTEASGGALDTFAGKNRIVVTATRSGQEGNNDTVFYQYFVDALTNKAADEDKDQKVSVWEAFKYAAQATERFYKEEGRLATEHSQISDNGGEKLTVAAKEAPALSRSTTFQVAKQATSSNPQVQALLNEKTEIENKISALRTVKDTMSQAEYEKQLEELEVQLALKNQQIREQEKKK
jgi:hypothetical protein